MAVFTLAGLYCSDTQADIYYSAKVAGPVINIHAINDLGQVTKITNNQRWRDIEHDVASNGLISFASNRKISTVNVGSRRQENYRIFVKNRKTEELLQISQQYEQARQPKFSPRGDQLAFIALEEQQQTLIVYDLVKKSRTALASAKRIYNFAWSPDNQRIALSSQDNKFASLAIVNSKDLTTQAIVSAAINQNESQKKSPQNTQGAFQNTQKSISRSTQVSVQIPPLLNQANMKQVEQLFVAPTWSPDGNYIAYISHPLTKQSSRALLVYELAKQKIQRISDVNIQVQAPMTWSSNSDSLLYSALVNYRQYYDDNIHKKVYLGGMHIFNSDLTGNNKQLTKGDHLFKQPVFSPDEKHIAYLYADKLNARTLQLNTMLADGSTQQLLRQGVAKNAVLQWQ
jgi:Tol biopolymer transport system component